MPPVSPVASFTPGRSGFAGAEAVTGRRTEAERRGRRAESMAALWLRLKGYRILARRFRSPAGEIDLVARRGRVLAFVEVKARREFAAAIEAVGRRQRERSIRAALAFLARHPRAAGCDLRFDIVIIRPRRLPHHLVNAWQAEGHGMP